MSSLPGTGGHLKPITLKPVSRIFRVFVSAFSVFSAFLLCGIFSDPYFSGVSRTFRIFRIFAVSGSNRWFRKSDQPALLWPALGDRWGQSLVFEAVLCETIFGPFPIKRCFGHFMGREVKGRWKFRMKAVKWVVANLQGDKTLGVLSHHLKFEMKSPHLVDFSWDLVEFESNLSRTLADF